jgi:hypothetical protein
LIEAVKIPTGTISVTAIQSIGPVAASVLISIEFEPGNPSIGIYIP